MDGFVPGLAIGTGMGMLLLIALVDFARDSSELTCKQQNWEGKACQCRLLMNSVEAAHD